VEVTVRFFGGHLFAGCLGLWLAACGERGESLQTSTNTGPSAVPAATPSSAASPSFAAPLSSAPPPSAAPLPQSAREQLQQIARHKRGLSEQHRKMSTALWLEAERGDRDGLLTRLPRLASRVELDELGRVEVEVEARVTPSLLARVRAEGGRVLESEPGYGFLRALLPATALPEFASDPRVRFVWPARGRLVHKDDTSEGDVAHRADVIRQSHGLDGSGVRIGVISDGVDSLPSVQASDDLPAEVTVLPGQAGVGDEGTAMLEIVHDLAPGAELVYATAGDSQARMAQNILDLAAAGCDVIVDDILFLAEVTFQDDVVAQAVKSVVDAGVLYFSATGNGGSAAKGTSGTYEADYTPAGTQPSGVATYPDDDWLDVHDFGGLAFDTITLDPPLAMVLEWSDSVGNSGNDYDLFLLTPDRADVLATSIDPQTGTGTAFEFIPSNPEDDAGNTLVVARWGGSERYVRLATHGGALSVGTSGSINGHPAVAEAFAIAAVDWFVADGAFVGGAGNPIEAFSSDGPRRMFFEPDGTPLTPGNFLSSGGVVRQKPDFAAADGVSTTTPGFSPFFGTSAAAPHAAALAALVLEARSDISALTGTARSAAMREAFVQAVLDVESTGFDVLSGHGLVMADAAVLPSCATEPDGTACNDADACTAVSSCQSGACVGSTPVVCEATDECHEVGVCDPSTGQCSNPIAPNGVSCDDGDACSASSSCQGGECVGDDVTACPGEDACFEASSCDPETGQCGAPERKSDQSGCDDDGDGVPNGVDGCPAHANPEQEDTDGDGEGDACDADDDADGFSDDEEANAGSDPTDPDDPGPAAGGGSSGGSNGAGAGGAGAGVAGAGAGEGEAGSSLGGRAGATGSPGGGGPLAPEDAGAELGDPGGPVVTPSNDAGPGNFESGSETSKFDEPRNPVGHVDAGSRGATVLAPEAPSGCDCRLHSRAPGTPVKSLLLLFPLVALWRRRATFRRANPCVGSPSTAC
jgi:hypothetical protein